MPVKLTHLTGTLFGLKVKSKTLDKQETSLRKHCVSHQYYPVCPPRETLLRKQNLLPSNKQETFW